MQNPSVLAIFNSNLKFDICTFLLTKNDLLIFEKTNANKIVFNKTLYDLIHYALIQSVKRKFYYHLLPIIWINSF